MLTTDEMRFFKRNGYLIKRGVLDPALMERARTRLWDGAPPDRRRDDPDTWVGPFRQDEENLDGANHRRGFRWNFREPGDEEWMVRLLATEPKVWAFAEQMLGKGQLVQPERIRGIYCTLPYGDHPPQTLGCHTDGHPFHLAVPPRPKRSRLRKSAHHIQSAHPRRYPRPSRRHRLLAPPPRPHG